MDDIRLYDFKKSKKFSLENIRNLTVMCEEFCKTSNMQINYETKSNDLRMSVNKSMQSTYGEFIESIDDKLDKLIEIDSRIWTKYKKSLNKNQNYYKILVR